MRFGVRLPHSGPFASKEAIDVMATSAERLGYDAVLVHDHVQWGDFDRYHFYAGSVEAVDALERATDFYEAHSVLAYLACKVPSLRLIPASIVLGWRDPTLVARLATTLYHLSEGRYVLSVCAGNVKKDFEVSGVPWEERGKRTEESLKIIRKLLREDGPQSHEGTFWHLEDVELFPKAPDLKIWYGGQSDAALRRTARFADGWLVGGSPDFYRQKVPTILRLAQEKYSRDLRLEVACLSPTSIAPTDAEAREVAEATVRKRQQEADWLKRTHDPRDIGGANLVGSPETIAARVREFADAGV
ncbi:MAG TPA: LLM class flavin-dependent oxidoreductase, partial [Trueperaceae bacterium]